MAYRQLIVPNLTVPAYRGWCLKYVDDCVNAKKRHRSAKEAYDTENRNGNTRVGESPIGKWVPIFFSFEKGEYVGLGHVAWAFNHGNGWVEIHDSETRSGARPVYRNVDELLRWFAKQKPKYLGWSLSVDGVKAVEEFTVHPSPDTSLKPAKGTAKVIVPVLNIRKEPNSKKPAVGQYVKGQTFKYDGYCIRNGYVWLSYVAPNGTRHYCAEGPYDGKKKTVYVKGGVSK